MRRRRRARRHSLEVAPRLLRGCYHQTPRRAAPAAASRRFYPLGRPSVVTAATTEPTAAASSSLSAQPPSIVSLCFSLSLLRSPIPHKIGRLGKREATARCTCDTPLPPPPPPTRRLCVLCRRHLPAPRSSEGHRRRTTAYRRRRTAAVVPSQYRHCTNAAVSPPPPLHRQCHRSM